jgi:predicted peptidase
MRSPGFVCAAALAAALAAPALMSQSSQPDTVQQPRVFSKEITRTVRLEYLLFLPKGCSAQSDRQWPLILFLHGAGERGTNVWLVATHGPPKIVRSQPDFGFIVVSPQCPSGTTWSNDALLALLDQIMAEYPVDPTRVYLTGLSMGGYGTWSLGLERPDRFAAIVPICGGGDPIRVRLADGKRIAAIKSLGVWAFHGGKDPVVRLAESERMVTTLKGMNCSDVQLTVYPEAGHDSWTETYANPKLYEWLLAHQRPKP